MSEYLPYKEFIFDKIVKLEVISNTPDDSDIGYFIEVDLKYPDNTKHSTKMFPSAPENKKIITDNFSEYMKENIPDTYTQN